MIAAIILAAGQSKRMGRPKMLLRWGTSTVIEHVIATFRQAGIEELLVVTGGAREQVQQVVAQYPVRVVHNDNYANGEMLSSLQCGLTAMPAEAQAALVGLGDQPQVREDSVRYVCQAYREGKTRLVIPSFRMRRGHPWLVARPLWQELLDLHAPQSPRDFLNRHADEIQYVQSDTDSILADLDTPEDYQRWHP